MVPTSYFVLLSAVLFTVGVLGVLIRRNALIVFMSIELMLNAANLSLVAFAQRWQSADGQIIVFFVITVAAAEVAVGLALLVAIFRSKRTTDIDEISTLKGSRSLAAKFSSQGSFRSFTCFFRRGQDGINSVRFMGQKKYYREDAMVAKNERA